MQFFFSKSQFILGYEVNFFSYNNFFSIFVILNLFNFFLQQQQKNVKQHEFVFTQVAYIKFPHAIQQIIFFNQNSKQPFTKKISFNENQNESYQF